MHSKNECPIIVSSARVGYTPRDFEEWCIGICLLLDYMSNDD